MRLLALGDTHGCTVAFDTLMQIVCLQPEDQLVALGDYVDRGPDSKGMIERMLALHRKGHLVALRGNHEYMMLEACKGDLEKLEWERCGGAATLLSYGVADREPEAPARAALATLAGASGSVHDDAWFEKVPKDHWHFLEEICLDWYETDTHFFAHANVDPDLPLADQPLYLLHWEKLYESRPHVSGKIMICGHTPQPDGKPLNLGHAVCIDTWIYRGGWLTCLDVNTGKYWQANQRSEKRTGMLEAPVCIGLDDEAAS